MGNNQEKRKVLELIGKFEEIRDRMLTFEIDDIKEGSSFFMEIFKKQNDFEKKFLEKKTGEIL